VDNSAPVEATTVSASQGSSPPVPSNDQLSARRLPKLAASLASRDFRWLMASIAAGSTANWIEIVVRSWIVYDMSGSALAMGAVQASKQVPLLFVSFAGGVLADRMDRKVLLISSQLASACIAAVLGSLVLTELIEWWYFAVASLLEGVVGAVQQPARQALIPSVVPRAHLMNAVALNSSTQTIAKMGGPLLAGLALATTGPASALFLEAATYGTGSLAMSRVHLHAPDPEAIAGGTWGQARHKLGWIEGFRGYGYMRQNPVVGWLATLALVPILFSLANQTLAPIFAKDVLHIGAGGAGLLLGAPAVGGVIGIFFVASTADDLQRKGLITLAGVVVLGIATIAYGASPWLWLSLGALAVWGFANLANRSLSQGLLQLHTPDEYRGRVMAVWAADRGLAPISTMAIAFVTNLWGAPTAVILSGVGCVLVALLVGVASRTIRELD
jgi:MFS family permease